MILNTLQILLVLHGTTEQMTHCNNSVAVILGCLHTNIDSPMDVVPVYQKPRPRYGDLIMNYLMKKMYRRQGVTKSIAVWKSNMFGYNTLLVKYMDKLQSERSKTLNTMLKTNLAWTYGTQANQRVLYAESNHYLEKFNQYNFVKTIKLNIQPKLLLKVSNDVFEYHSNKCKFIDKYSSETNYPSQCNDVHT